MKSTFGGYLFFSIAFVFGLSFASCNQCVEGEGEVVNQKRTLDNFSKISIELNAEVILVKGESGITIEAQPNIQSLIQAEVKRNKLRLSASSCVASDTPIKITITSPIYTNIELDGQVSLSSISLITAKKLYLSANHSSTLKLNVFVNDLDVTIKDNAMLMITGNCQNAEVEMKGALMFDGFGFNASSMDIELYGSGKATVSVLNKLSAKVEGSGEIIYSGDPQVVTKIEGSGRVTKVN